MRRGNDGGQAEAARAMRVLVVDDDPPLCDLMRLRLAEKGISATTRTSAEAALTAINSREFDAVVTDVQLPRMSGLELCKRITAERPHLPVLVITAFGNMDSAVAAMRAGATDFITKPIEMDAVGDALTRATFRPSPSRDANGEPAGIDAILGDSPAMEKLRALVSRAARSDASVLITGESGTGKELVAQALHAGGRRGAAPFVAMNCAAVPEALLESELFGHVRGAFTDAKEAREGLLLEANGGTLFLDEIGDLALRLQPKLLRALQERRARPLGARAEVPFDVRFVAATNDDVLGAVRARRFREDLYFRINVIPIEVPPLRARGDDVVLLAERFAAVFAARDGRVTPSFSDAALAHLRAYHWPGNVRELQNCVEHAIALTDRDRIEPTDFPEISRAERTLVSAPSHPALPAADTAELVSLAEIERRHIVSVLAAVNGNKRLAARVLGVDRRTLYRKLESYEGVPGSAGSSIGVPPAHALESSESSESSEAVQFD